MYSMELEKNSRIRCIGVSLPMCVCVWIDKTIQKVLLHSFYRSLCFIYVMGMIVSIDCVWWQWICATRFVVQLIIKHAQESFLLKAKKIVFFSRNNPFYISRTIFLTIHTVFQKSWLNFNYLSIVKIFVMSTKIYDKITNIHCFLLIFDWFFCYVVQFIFVHFFALSSS